MLDYPGEGTLRRFRCFNIRDQKWNGRSCGPLTNLKPKQLCKSRRRRPGSWPLRNLLVKQPTEDLMVTGGSQLGSSSNVRNEKIVERRELPKLLVLLQNDNERMLQVQQHSASVATPTATCAPLYH